MFRLGGLFVAVCITLTCVVGTVVSEAHADGYVGDFYLLPPRFPLASPVIWCGPNRR